MKKLSKQQDLVSKLDIQNIVWGKKIDKILENIRCGTGKVPDTEVRSLQEIAKLNKLIGGFKYKKALNFMQNLDTITKEDCIPYKIWDLLHKINGEQ